MYFTYDRITVKRSLTKYAVLKMFFELYKIWFLPLFQKLSKRYLKLVKLFSSISSILFLFHNILLNVSLRDARPVNPNRNIYLIMPI